MKTTATVSRRIIPALIALLLALPAFALDLDGAKAKGFVGETTAGYLGVVKSSSEVNALVNDINEGVVRLC